MKLAMFIIDHFLRCKPIWFWIICVIWLENLKPERQKGQVNKKSSDGWKNTLLFFKFPNFQDNLFYCLIDHFTLQFSVFSLISLKCMLYFIICLGIMGMSSISLIHLENWRRKNRFLVTEYSVCKWKIKDFL